MEYLVDVGRLVPVTEVSARAALDLAVLDVGPEKLVVNRALVYVLDPQRSQILEVIGA